MTAEAPRIETPSTSSTVRHRPLSLWDAVATPEVRALGAALHNDDQVRRIGQLMSQVTVPVTGDFEADVQSLHDQFSALLEREDPASFAIDPTQREASRRFSMRVRELIRDGIDPVAPTTGQADVAKGEVPPRVLAAQELLDATRRVATAEWQLEDTNKRLAADAHRLAAQEVERQTLVHEVSRSRLLRRVTTSGVWVAAAATIATVVLPLAGTGSIGLTGIAAATAPAAVAARIQGRKIKTNGERLEDRLRAANERPIAPDREQSVLEPSLEWDLTALVAEKAIAQTRFRGFSDAISDAELLADARVTVARAGREIGFVPSIADEQHPFVRTTRTFVRKRLAVDDGIPPESTPIEIDQEREAARTAVRNIEGQLYSRIAAGDDPRTVTRETYEALEADPRLIETLRLYNSERHSIAKKLDEVGTLHTIDTGTLAGRTIRGDFVFVGGTLEEPVAPSTPDSWRRPDRNAESVEVLGLSVPASLYDAMRHLTYGLTTDPTYNVRPEESEVELLASAPVVSVFLKRDAVLRDAIAERVTRDPLIGQKLKDRAPEVFFVLSQSPDFRPDFGASLAPEALTPKQRISYGGLRV